VKRKGASSAWTRLLREPRRFGFDAAVRLLLHRARIADPAEAARFRSLPGTGFPASEVTDLVAPAQGRPRLTVALIGLVGAAGVLPRLYGDLAGQRGRSASLHDFLDMLAQRMVAGFAQAGIKYRLHRAAETAALARPPEPDPVARALLALSGHGTPGLADRLQAGQEPLLHYAGLFAMRPRSAERLCAMLSDWLGRPVVIEQFAGAWLDLPPDQRTALPRNLQPGAWNQLGVDAAIGVRSWDPQARIILRIGPLDRAGFEALLPDAPGHRRLVSLVRSFLGLETAFAINPVLAREAMFPAQLSEAARPRLGWNCWSAASSTRRTDAADAVFSPN
jgi:type VI secretion system protein ImpH